MSTGEWPQAGRAKDLRQDFRVGNRPPVRAVRNSRKNLPGADFLFGFRRVRLGVTHEDSLPAQSRAEPRRIERASNLETSDPRPPVETAVRSKLNQAAFRFGHRPLEKRDT